MKWKTVKGFEGLYDVSDSGEVRTYRKQVKGRQVVCEVAQKLLSKCNDKNNYLQVCLRKDGRSLTKKIHRLVLETYVGLCPEGMECRHLDGNPKNNNLYNLSWGTHKENAQDMIAHGKSTRGEKNPMAILDGLVIRRIRYLAKTTSMPHQQIADILGLKRRNVTKIINRKRWSHI